MNNTSSEKGSMLSTVKYKGVEWIDVQDPSTAKLKELKKKYGFHPLDFEDTLSPVQRPKLEMQDNYIFLVFRFPFVSKRTNKLHAVELDVFLYKKQLITFHSKNAKSVRAILSDAKLFKEKREHLLGQGPGHLLYEILKKLFEESFALTDEISLELEKLESSIFQKTRDQKIITELSELRRKVIDFRKIAKPQTSFLNHVLNSVNGYLGSKQGLYWRNLIELADNQWEILETHLETVNGLATTNDSLAGYRLNETFRLLTIISVLFIPTTFVLDILSTDTPGNPFSNFQADFLIIIGILILSQIGFIYFLRKKRVL